MATVPAVLRYSRHHGICYDYRQEHPFCKLEEIDLCQDLASLPDLPDFSPPHTEPPTDSKLELSQKASKLLASATTQPPVPGWTDLLSDRPKSRLRRVEQPLLLTDHEKDMRRFLPKRSIGSQDIDFALEILREDDDEGLSWPASIRTICAQIDEEIAHEKMPMTKDSLRLLKCIIRDNWTPEAHRSFVQELLMSKKPALQQIMPLLLPDHAVSSSTVLSSPPLRLMLTSDPPSLTSLPTESPPQGLGFEGYQTPFKGPTPDFKLPTYHLNYSKYKGDDLGDYHAGETSSSTVAQDINNTEGEGAESTRRNDFVSASSLLSHISVPNLSLKLPAQSYTIPSLPIADGRAVPFQDEKSHNHLFIPIPQPQKRESSPTKLVAFSGDLETIVPTIVHGVTIPSSLKLLFDGLEGHAYEPSLPKNIIKSHQMLWRPEKLSLLKEDDDDQEELVLDYDVGKCEIEDDCSIGSKCEVFLQLTGSPSHLEDTFEISYGQLAKEEEKTCLPSKPEGDDISIPKKRKPLGNIINDAKRQQVVSVGSLSRFSASGSLSSFLGTRQDMPTPEVEVSLVSEKQAEVLVPGTPDPMVKPDVPSEPNMPILTPPRTIFFSATYLQRYRSLLRFFETWAGVNLNIVYRDLNIPLLLSPKHAVIITTLQALTQRPLPGQDSGRESAIHDQISLLSRGYVFDFLVVLVSAPTVIGNNEKTIGSFTTFCQTMSKSSTCQIRPWYIPASEADLHASVAKLILEYGFRTEDLIFHEDETHEERLLVRTGMNHFAAQVVLSVLHDDGSGRTWGSRAFVQMDAAEREERFGGLIGETVLERVGRRIEAAMGRGELV